MQGAMVVAASSSSVIPANPFVIPAKAGIQRTFVAGSAGGCFRWIPAFAGMTVKGIAAAASTWTKKRGGSRVEAAPFFFVDPGLAPGPLT
jgi:hypothetical protein